MSFAGHRVDLSRWNSKTQRVKNGTVNLKGESATDINSSFSTLESRINEVFRQFEVKGEIPSPEDVRGAIRGDSGSDKRGNMELVFDAHLQYMEKRGRANNWSPNTFKKHRTVGKHLYDFDPKLRLKDIDRDKVDEFIKFLHGLGMQNVSVEKHLKGLYEFLRWCEGNDLFHNPKIWHDRPRLKGTDGKHRAVIFLTWDELMDLYNHPFKTARHRHVRDVFCFQCFTGLRYSDVANLKRRDVSADSITITTIKTGDRLQIELNKYSRAILDKYAGIEYEGGEALPVVSNQKMNDYIKEICAEVGIDSPVTVVHFKGARRSETTYPKYTLITSHAGRRTFVTNSLAMGIPSEVIMRWTGHKSHKVMRPYLEIVDRLKVEQMGRWDTY
jgi:integrase